MLTRRSLRLLTVVGLVLVFGHELSRRAEAAPQPRLVLVPTRVTTQPGGTDVSVPFTIASPVQCPCVVRVDNGSGGVPAAGGVAEGWVWVDGAPVFSPPAVSLTNPTALATLTLAGGAHVLRIRIVGRPGSYVTVSVQGVIPLADLTVGRADHTATLAADGSVVVAGGDGSGGPLSSIERVDAVTRTTSVIGALSAPRAAAVAAVLPTGELWIAGGRAGAATSSMELVSSMAEPLTVALLRAREQHTATALADGRLLVLGGTDGSGQPLADGELIDPRPPATSAVPYNIRAATTSALAAATQLARLGHTATLLPNGAILIVGGRSAQGDLASIELFDVITGTGTVLPVALATPRSGHSATLMPDGSVVVAGGRSGATLLDTIEVIHAGVGGVSLGSSRLQIARADHSATLLPGGEMLVAGGRGAAGILAHTELLGPPSADLIGPDVAAFDPAPGAAGVPRSAIVGVRFSEPVDPRSVTPATLGVDHDGVRLAATVAVSDDGLVAYLVPLALLPADVTLAIAVSGIVDMAGNPLAPTSATFRTSQDVDPGPMPSRVEVFPAAASLGLPGAQDFTATAEYPDGSRVDVTSEATWSSASDAVAAIDAAGAALAAGVGITSVTASFRTVSGSATVRVYAGEPIPPDPVLVAPPRDRFSLTAFDDAIAFLFEGQNPIQRGMTPGTIAPRRASVIRGRIIDRDGVAITGARVSVVAQPNYGYTLSRDDGRFDLAVNGGGALRLEATLAGYLPAERTLEVAWNAFKPLDDIALVALDPVVTPIDLGAATTVQVARGSVVVDDDGQRQATLLLAPGTVATGVRPDGSTVALPVVSVRATEYTVGALGPRAIPAALPPTSAYTYAVEFSVDEAIAAGASEVRFSQPVIAYTENFLRFPAGVAVPSAYFDRTRGAWVPVPNGRVISITAEAGGLAELDVDGGGPDGPAALALLGITQTEQQELATLYEPGQSLWRLAVDHFSPYDLNWPRRPPDGAQYPQTSAPGGGTNTELDSDECKTGSIIECQSQSLGEAVPIVGTGLSLVYRSSRVPKRKDPYTITGPLTKATVPASLKRVELFIIVAGRSFFSLHPAQPNQTYAFTWDGRDVYERDVLGTTEAIVEIGYVYDATYTNPAAGDRSFGLPGQTSMTQDATRDEVVLRQTHRVVLGRLTIGAGNSNGWSISAQHWPDPTSGYLFYGDGRKHGPQSVPQAATTVIGPALQSSNSLPVPPTPATRFTLTVPRGLVVAGDGAVYVSNGAAGSSYLTDGQWLGGVQTTYRADAAGQLQSVAPGSAGVVRALGADGSLYFVDPTQHVVRRQRPNGVLEVVAGSGVQGFSGDGGPAVDAQLARPFDVAVAADGTVYISDAENGRVRRVAPDGFISTYAGGGFTSPFGQDIWARDAFLGGIRGVTLGPDGLLYLTNRSDLFRVTGDGVLRRIPYPSAGTFSDLDVGPDGSVYAAGIGLSLDGRSVARVDPAGARSFVANSGGLIVEGGVARQSMFQAPHALAAAPDGRLHVLSAANAGTSSRVLQVAQPGTQFVDEASVRLMASIDGSEVFVFDHTGRHLRTVDAGTGVTLLTFEYNGAGLLTGILDRHGKRVQLERSGVHLTAIVAPGGERTAVRANSSGFIEAVTDPGGGAWAFGYSSNGLMTSFKRPASPPSTFAYDDERLSRDDDPAGGFTELDVTRGTGSWSTMLTTAEGRTESFVVERLADFVTRRTDTDPAGLQTITTEFPDGRRTVIAPDGTETTLRFGADLRFGPSVQQLQSLTIRTPGGAQLSVNGSRETTLSDPNNLLSVSTDSSFLSSGLLSVSRHYQAAFSRITERVGSLTTLTTLDPLGRPATVQLGNPLAPSVLPVQFSYDTDGRLSEVLQGTRRATIGYDAQHRPTVLTDALNREVRFSYDANGRILTQTLPDQRVIGFSYDTNGNLTSVTPPTRPAHTFTYTPLDFAASYSPPSVAGTGATQYRYNRDRQIVGIDRPDGVSTGFQYDPAGRLVGVVLGGTGTLTYSYDSVGRVGTVTMPDGQGLTYTYDGFLPLSEQWTGGAVGQVSRTYGTDLVVASETVSGTAPVTFNYGGGLLRRAGVSVLTRNDIGAPATVEVGGLSGVTETIGYGPFGEPASRSVRYAFNAPFVTQSYTRDALRRIETLTEELSGVTHTFSYTYDLAGRLARVERDLLLVAEYTYDGNGHRALTQTATETIASTVDAQDRLLTFGATSYTYTANGERRTATTAGQTTTYTYDVLGNLTRVQLPDGRDITYAVDGRGRRVQKRVNGVAVQGWLWSDQLRLAAELDGAGAVVARFVYASRYNVPDYVVKDGITYRIVADHLGSPRVLVDVASGTIVQRLDYDAFGVVTQDTNPGFQPLGFAGGLYDRDTGLVRFGARDYDARVGAWTAKDPIAFAAADPNLYSYSFVDPVNFVDPSGQIAAHTVGIGIGVVVGAVSGAAGAIVQDAPVQQVLAAGVIGGVAGGFAGASTASAVFVGLAAGLSDVIGQLVGSLGPCEFVPNVGSVVGAVGAGIIASKFGAHVPILPGFHTQNGFFQELAKAAAAVPASMLSIAGGALDPFSIAARIRE